jgi:hypothetical protein
MNERRNMVVRSVVLKSSAIPRFSLRALLFSPSLVQLFPRRRLCKSCSGHEEQLMGRQWFARNPFISRGKLVNE